MPRFSTSRTHCPREASVRGLGPGIVSAIAVGVMLCGFAIAGRETSGLEETTVAIDQDRTESVVNLSPFQPAEQRALMLSDADALYKETLWLARCIYSETGRRHEQALVAWVVRNRVETRYRGESTYAAVVIDPFQFSAFNRGSLTREFLLTVDSTYTSAKWEQALDVARDVILADSELRPFSITTRHFYSERSLDGAEIPMWALELEPVDVYPFLVDEKRFRFFDRVS